MKKLSNILITIGIILLIGTIGASDVGTITMHKMFSQISHSFTFMLFGFAVKLLPIILRNISIAAKRKAKRYSYQRA